MFALKVSILLTVAYLAHSADIDWLPCIQQIVINGDATVNVPGHDPLYIPRNVSISEKISIFTVTGQLTNLVWYNIPWWTVRNFTEVYNDDNFLVYDFNFYWDNFTITAKYDVALTSILEHLEYAGDVIINMTEVTWAGSFNISKATADSIEYVNDLQISWTNGDVEVDVTNLEAIEAALDISLKVAFDTLILLGNDVNAVGQAFQMTANDRWLANSTRIAAFTDYCNRVNNS